MLGYFDFQINGFGGVDFQQDDLSLDGARCACAALRGTGVDRIFVTFITAPIDGVCRRLAAFERFCQADEAIRRMVAGYHLEGPWLNPEAGYRGAHAPELMHAPSIREYRLLQDAANGRIRLVTLAPEWPESAEAITAMRAEQVHVALGHTNANEAQIGEAIRAGALFCTHLGNGVPAMLPRHDNVMQRLLARDELTACFIPDGIHLPPYVLKNFWRAKPAGRVLFTTDAMAGAAAGPGDYTLAHARVTVADDGIAWQPDRSGFAGSTLTPEQGVRNITAWLGIPPAQATALWSIIPATAFGI